GGADALRFGPEGLGEDRARVGEVPRLAVRLELDVDERAAQRRVGVAIPGLARLAEAIRRLIPATRRHGLARVERPRARHVAGVRLAALGPALAHHAHLLLPLARRRPPHT